METAAHIRVAAISTSADDTSLRSPPSLHPSRHWTRVIEGGHSVKIVVTELQALKVVAINAVRLEDLLPDPL